MRVGYLENFEIDKELEDDFLDYLEEKEKENDRYIKRNIKTC